MIHQILISTIILILVIQLHGAEEYAPMKFKNCKSKFEILSVDAIGCGGGDRCTFYHNTEPRIRIGFKPDRAVSEMRTSVWANLGDANGALAKFHLENDKTCAGNNITCPLEAGKTYYYSQAVRILNEYPTVDVQVNWLVTSDDGKSADNSDGVPSGRDICIKFLGTVKHE